jgi:arylsulfatase A-like enzyme
LVEFVDVYPTLCELARLPVPDHLEGSSLVPLLDDALVSVKEAAFSQFPRHHAGCDLMGYAMRTDRYRYVEWLDAATGEITATELYDNRTDPDENTNIAMTPDHAPLLQTLHVQMWQTLPRPKFPLPIARPKPSS